MVAPVIEPRVNNEQCEECGAPHGETHNFACTVRIHWLQSEYEQARAVNTQYDVMVDELDEIASILNPRPCIECGASQSNPCQGSCDCGCHLPITMQITALRAACRMFDGMVRTETTARVFYQKTNNRLLMALEAAVSIADEAFRLWDSDNDSRVGKILWALGSPKANGYRQDIDDIHEAIASAKAPA